MKRSHAAVIVVIALLVAVVFGIRYYQKDHYRESLEPAIKNVSIRTSNTLEVLMRENGITFDELFKKLDADTSDIDQRIIDIQSNVPNKYVSLSEPVVDYLRDCQGVNRAVAQKYKKYLTFTSAIEGMQSAVRNSESNRAVSLSYNLSVLTKAQEDAKAAHDEYGKSVANAAKFLDRLEASAAKLGLVYDQSIIVKQKQIVDLSSLMKKEASGYEKKS